MASSPACNIEHEGPDSTADCRPSPLTAVSGAEQAIGYEVWRDRLASVCGRYSAAGAELVHFVGSVRPVTLCGSVAMVLSCNASRIDRTIRDARRDGTEHYYVLLQLDGQSTTTLIQNDRIAQLSVGDIALIDSARPVTYFRENRPGRWLTLQLPRRSLISHLGVEPVGGSYGCGDSLAGRLLFSLIDESVSEFDSAPISTEPCMQLVICDLLGALIGVKDQPARSSHTDKLFRRMSDIIRSHFADSSFGPAEVAAEAGISLRYLQKLFTLRGCSCTHFINSVRLDEAARQLHRRAMLKTMQPISEIAYAVGFNDYAHFARQFRRRFGHPPGVHAPESAGTSK